MKIAIVAILVFSIVLSLPHQVKAASGTKQIIILVTDNSGLTLKGVDVCIIATNSKGIRITKKKKTNAKGKAVFVFSDIKPSVHIIAMLLTLSQIRAFKSTAGYCPGAVNKITIKLDYF